MITLKTNINLALLPLLFLVFLFPSPTNAQNFPWEELLFVDYGEAAEDQNGYSTAISDNGNEIASAAPRNNGNGTESGHVRVFARSSSTGWQWLQRGADIDGEAANDRSGYSISLNVDGTIVAIGAYGNIGSGSNAGAGHVRVYAWNGSNWIQMGADIDGGSGDNSGWSVDLSNDGFTVAVGAPFRDNISAYEGGGVRVYTWDGTVWNQKGADINGADSYDHLGLAVCLTPDGNSLIVGAPQQPPFSAEPGYAKVLDWNGSAWVQRGMNISGVAPADFSGASVSFSSDGMTIAIGAKHSNGPIAGEGFVRVFDWDGNAWVQRGNLPSLTSGWTSSLSSSGFKIAVGFPYDSQRLDSGLVRVYQWTGNAWSQTGNDIKGQNAQELLGYSLQLAGVGNVLVVGGIGNNHFGPRTGVVRIYSDIVVGVEEANQFPTDVTLYPNPSSGNFNLLFKRALPKITLTIRNAFGQTISSKEYRNAKQVQLEIEGSAGIYSIEMRTPENHTSTFKAVVE